MSNIVTANISFNSEGTYRIETGPGNDNVIRIVGRSPSQNTIHIGKDDRITVNGVVNLVNSLVVTANIFVRGWAMSNTVAIIPTLTFGGGNTGMTYSTRLCQATITPNKVTFQVRISLTLKGTSTGSAIITLPGLPPPIHTASGYVGYWSGMAANAQPQAVYIQGNGQASGGANLFLGIHGTGATRGTTTHTQFSNTTDYIVDGFYFTA